jgi:hypothetical protein
MSDQKDDFKFEIKKSIGEIGEGTRGWKKEVNVISWNGWPPKRDIRDWIETHEKMGRGVTLSGSEARALLDLLGGVDLDELED